MSTSTTEPNAVWIGPGTRCGPPRGSDTTSLAMTKSTSPRRSNGTGLTQPPSIITRPSKVTGWNRIGTAEDAASAGISGPSRITTSVPA